MSGLIASSVVIVWLGIGITTGKFSENLGVWLFESKVECQRIMLAFEDSQCVPIATTKEGAEAMAKEMKGR